MLWHMLFDGARALDPFVCSFPVQSQAQSTSKEMVDAGTEAEFEIETENLRNQFNFNDRATQVRVIHVLCRHKIVYQLQLSDILLLLPCAKALHFRFAARMLDRMKLYRIAVQTIQTLSQPQQRTFDACIGHQKHNSNADSKVLPISYLSPSLRAML